MAWYSEGEKLNPADGTVLATTGKIMTGNNTGAGVIVAATVLAVVIVELRDAANAATRMNQTVRVLANDTRVVPLGTQPLEPGESLRVIVSGAVVGSVHASIVY